MASAAYRGSRGGGPGGRVQRPDRSAQHGPAGEVTVGVDRPAGRVVVVDGQVVLVVLDGTVVVVVVVVVVGGGPAQAGSCRAIGAPVADGHAQGQDPGGLARHLETARCRPARWSTGWRC